MAGHHRFHFCSPTDFTSHIIHSGATHRASSPKNIFMAESNFVDYVKIFCRSGKGGRGSMHLHRAKYQPNGGPDGGDGGRGGHVYLRGNHNYWTLLHLRYERHVFAGHGGNGSKCCSHGADGEDKYIDVPCGTVVYDAETGKYICDVTEDGQVVNLSAEAMALRGEKLVCKAESDICTADFSITKNGKAAPCRMKPGQIIISPVDRDRLEGRAVYGALCSAAYTPCKAAVALTEQVMISAEAEDAGMESFCCIEHMLFGPEDEVSITGLTCHAQLILDGNPYIRTAETVVLRFLPDLITVAMPLRKG